MLDAIIGLFRPKPEPAKKREWSIRDDMRIRAQYARETGSNVIYVTQEEYFDILSLDDTRVYLGNNAASIVNAKSELHCYGLPVQIRNKED